ncbi:MFS transporter [Aaosphaeria arxii CBS 175.79]|uniref:MFS transporter n=1 Tax=Aaosphaeria arxii CBS 175.79 TaxID=1450172 RepID=A0A6A5XQ21_9PLEO|nr:MFS transporter [Aaosphaeria arxii CBS 175.79]KAF2015252.1 MFS transporter [Aaosphaeria arxii CBS 175.79]
MAGGAVISANPLKLDLRSHLKCLLMCFVATISTFQYGLDYAVIGGFLSMPGFLKVYGYYDEKRGTWNIDPTVQQLISSLMVIGTFFSSLMVGPFSQRFGRRMGLWCATIVNFVATGIMLGTTSKAALYFARFLLGISVGWFLTFSQVYVHEVAPAHLRGIAFAVYQTQLSTGSVVGAVLDYATHKLPDRRAYQIPLAVMYAAPAIQFICLFWLPETPRWLMVQKKEEEAEAALRRLRNANIDESEFQAEYNEIREGTLRQMEGSKAVWADIWKGTHRRRTLLAIAVICFHAGTGSSWVVYYTTYYLEKAKVSDPFAYSILTTCCGILGVLFSFFYVRKIDRRDIMLYGLLGCGLFQLMPAVAWTCAPNSQAAANAVVASVALFKFAYTTLGPYAWLIGGEYPNNQQRGYVFGIASALNFLLTWLGTFTAPFFINPAALGWNAQYGYIWFGSNIIMVVFTFFFLPETRDRTLEEIHEMFEAKLPARKFKGYVCVGVESMAAKATGKEGDALLADAAHDRLQNWAIGLPRST